MVQPLREPVWPLLIELTTFSPGNPAIALLSIHQKELKLYAHTKACIGMFAAALFVTAKTKKQPDVLQ